MIMTQVSSGRKQWQSPSANAVFHQARPRTEEILVDEMPDICAEIKTWREKGKARKHRPCTTPGSITGNGNRTRRNAAVKNPIPKDKPDRKARKRRDSGQRTTRTLSPVTKNVKSKKRCNRSRKTHDRYDDCGMGFSYGAL